RGKTIRLILLLAIITFSVVNTAVWLLLDTRPPRWDEANYLTLSLKHHAALTAGGVGPLVQSLLSLDPQRPPLVPALAVPAYLVLGKRLEVPLAVNLVAFAVVVLAVYGLGARLVSGWCGLLAAFLISVYPGVFSLARLFVLDFCDMAVVAVVLYCLARTESFSQRGPALTFGLVAGLGLLCRAFFPIFLLGPLGVSLYAAWREGKRSAGEGSKLAWPVNSGLA